MDKTKIEYTDEQLQAINTEGSLIVSASAGSGKTTVMIERIFRLLCQGVDIDNIFITTFTKASALDMKQKLKAKLQSVEYEVQGLKVDDIIDSIDTTNIGTFHSVCAKIIRTHFYSCGVDPDFILIDEKEADYLLFDSISSVVDSFNKCPTQDYLNLYRVFLSARKDIILKELIKKIYYFVVTQKSPQDWIDNCLKLILNPSEIDQMIESQRLELKKSLQDSAIEYQDRAKAVGMDFGEYVQELLNAINGKTNIDGSSLKISKKSVKCDESNALCIDLYSEFKDFRTKTKIQMQKLFEDRVDSSLCYPYVKTLLDLVQSAKAKYQAKKIKYAKLDFNDIEHTMIKVLQDQVARQLLSQKIRYMFVDEYQDINPLQDEIISILSESAESFFVGDVKQSIYGFRMCDPKYFIDKLNDKANRVINLNGNFRSVLPILDFVNQVFATIMTPDLGGVDYIKNSMLVGSTAGRDNSVVVKMIEPYKNTKYSDISLDLYDPMSHENYLESDTKNLQAEIDSVAEHIYNLYESGVALKDIAVLVRSRGDFAFGLNARLKECGIESFVGIKSDLLDNEETAAVFYYLKIVDFPNDDIALTAVLSSGFYDISASQFERIVIGCQDKESDKNHMSFFDRCKYYLKCNQSSTIDCDQDLITQLKLFFDNLEYLNIYKYTHTVAQIANKIVSMHNYFFTLYGKSNGSAKAEVLYQYLDGLVIDPNNADLSRYVAHIDEYGDTIQEFEYGSVVKIMTAHSSKGLEYEYLILADMCHEFNKKDIYNSVLLHNCGIGIKYFDLDSGIAYKNSVYEYIQNLKNNQLISEEMRLLYVALTRAKKQLALFLRVPNADYSLPKDKSTSKHWMDFIFKICQGYNPQFVSPDFRLSNLEKVDTKKVYAKRSEPLIRHLTKIMDSAVYKYTVIGVETKSTVSRLLADQKGILSAEDTIDLQQVQQLQKLKQRGTDYHKALELMDFDIPFETTYQNILQRLGDRYLSKAKLQKAHQTIGNLVAGGQIYKERSFVLNRALTEDGDSLLQGKIDLIILNGQQATIVEYKSSLFKADLELYKMQLEMYKDAIQKIMQIFDVKTIIYDIQKSKLVEV